MSKFISMMLLMLIIVTGCAQVGYQNNQVYLVERDGEHKVSDFQGLIDTPGQIPFTDLQVDMEQNAELTNKILIAFNPETTKGYFMERTDNQPKTEIIKGEYENEVNLYEYDFAQESIRLIAPDTPFITKAAWNHNQQLLAFNGGHRLVIYDTKRKRLLMENILRHDPINYFFWSHNDNRIYSEHPGQVNGSIYYVNLQKKAEAYEIKGNLYLKGMLDENLFYGTRWIGLETEDQGEALKDNIYTVVVDSQNNIVKVIGKGIFRDAYKKSVILAGTDGFGLSFIPNIDKPEEIIQLNNEYIYQAGFVTQGQLFYLTKSKQVENNLFTMHLVNSNGREIKSFDLSSPALSLLPNGRIGYVGGFKEETIDFPLNEIISNKSDVEPENSINPVLRMAADIIYKHQVYQYNDWHLARNYFLENEEEDWSFLKEKGNKINIPPYKSKITIIQKNLQDEQANVTILVEINSSTGEDYQVQYNLDLIKENNNWLIIKKTGD